MTEKSLFDKIKEVGSHTVIYGLGSALQTLIGFILLPFYTRYYTTDMYGVLALLTLCSALAGSVFYLGATSALARSYYDHTDGYERKKAISTSFYISLFGASLQILLGFMLGDTISLLLFHSTAYSLHVTIILASSAITFVNNLFFMLLRFERKSAHVVIFNLMSLLLLTALILFFLIQLKLGVLAPILGGLITQIVSFVVLFSIVKESIVLDFSKHELKLQFNFGAASVVLGLSYFVLDWIDRLFINKYCSLSDVGIYSLGYQIGSAVNILFIMPFSQIWSPMMMEYRHDKNAGQLYTSVTTYYFLIGSLIAIVISVFSNEFLRIIGGNKEYLVAYKVVPFVMFGYLFYGVVNIITVGIYFERKLTYYVYIFCFSLLVNVVLNYIFIPKFGYMAAAYITLITYIVLALFSFVVSNTLYKVHVEGKRLLQILASGLFVLIAGNLRISDRIVYAALFKSFLIFSLLVFGYLFILNENEKKKIHAWMGRSI